MSEGYSRQKDDCKVLNINAVKTSSTQGVINHVQNHFFHEESENK
jgi:hypothetical protein